MTAVPLQRPSDGAVEIVFDWNELRLAGSLHRPDAGDLAHPTVLMLQGSGASDRHSGGFFEAIRAVFLDRGIATFAFDKPGCGVSTGDWRRHGLDARADQASVALETLRGHHSVDPDRMGVFGHSQGGWLVQMLAARTPDLAFAIANSAPSIGVAAQMLYDCEHDLRHNDVSESDIGDALEFMTELHAAARRGEDFESVEAKLLDEARRRTWFARVAVGDEADWLELVLWATEPYDPIESLRRVRCPFLAVYGALDRLLPPWRSASETAAALHQGGIRDATVVVMPTGNHRIQDADSETFVPGYIDLVGDWAARRIRPNAADSRGSGVL